MRTEAAASEARCPLHPERPSVGTCSRCGRFLCLDCRGPRGQCRQCAARGLEVLKARAPAALTLLRVSAGSEALSLLVAGTELVAGNRQAEQGADAFSGAEVAQALVAVAQGILFLATAVVFLRWWRAGVQVVTDRGVAMNTTPGRAVWYWFLPLANLVWPYRVTATVARNAGVSPPLQAWWACWVASNLLTSQSWQAASRGGQLASLASWFDLGAAATGIAAALLCARVVRSIQDGFEVQAADP